MTLPVLLSVPHAGLTIPDWLEDRCTLTDSQIELDGDVGAGLIYDLADEVKHFTTTTTARAVLDLNRAEGDYRSDGVVKTHTCWDEPVWRTPLAEQDVKRLMHEVYRPYHANLSSLAGEVLLGVDGHTMAAWGPPIGPDPGQERPAVCIGSGNGACPAEWVEILRHCFAERFPGPVTVDQPFAGGYITRQHGMEMPWVQIELSRSSPLTLEQRRAAVLAALEDFCRAATTRKGA